MGNQDETTFPGEADWYNPMKFGAMAVVWCQRAIELETISDEARQRHEKTPTMGRRP